MSFKELVGGLLDVAIPTFGETIDYRPNAGGSFSIEAVFDRSFEQIDPDTEEVIASNVPMLGIKLANTSSVSGSICSKERSNTASIEKLPPAFGR